MSANVNALPVPSGPGSAEATPGLPDGFTDVFASRMVTIGDDLHMHAVVGGDGPPLLLLAGWPQTWYAWRLIMPALARDYTVIAPDPRGVGLSDKPADGYDLATLAADMVALMAALGHERFAMFGHDVGMWTGYALAADHPERIERLVLAEAVIPGLAPSPPVFAPQAVVGRLWHFMFNRLEGLNEQLVAGREDMFFRWQFANKTVHPLAETAIAHYVESIARSPEALRACFGFYRAIDEDIAQNAKRAASPLTLPILTIAGAQSTGATVEQTIDPVASDVRSIVFDDCGHFPAEEAPEATLAAITEFFAPYRASRVAGDR
ncbi:MAG TPA: alpha/beta hydrolase [Pseudonocardia sp.]